MNDLIESLRKLGWNDDLIKSYVGKEIQSIDVPTLSMINELKPISNETNNIIIESNENFRY